MAKLGCRVTVGDEAARRAGRSGPEPPASPTGRLCRVRFRPSRRKPAGEPFDLIVIRRGICCVPYEQARHAIHQLLLRLKIGGKLYLSILGLHSERGRLRRRRTHPVRALLGTRSAHGRQIRHRAGLPLFRAQPVPPCSSKPAPACSGPSRRPTATSRGSPSGSDRAAQPSPGRHGRTKPCGSASTLAAARSKSSPSAPGQGIAAAPHRHAQGDYLATVMAVAGLVEAAEGSWAPAPRWESASRVRNRGPPASSATPIRPASTANLCRDLQALLQGKSGWPTTPTASPLSEASDGAGADAATVFGVILGTGVGAAW